MASTTQIDPRLVIAFAGVGACALLIACSIGWALWGEPNPYPVHEELYKSALQVIVVGIIGSLATLVVQSGLKVRDQLASLRELRKDASRRVIEAYMAAKKIRRQLRAGADVRVLFEPLNDVQLTLESIKRELKTTSLFTRSGDVVAAVRAMEKYLGAIVSEYERPISDGEAFFPFNRAVRPKTEDFTGEYEGSCFQAQFVDAFAVALDLMQAEIVGDDPFAVTSPAKEKVSKTPVPAERTCPQGRFKVPER
jgi:hypothetical protein